MHACFSHSRRGKLFSFFFFRRPPRGVGWAWKNKTRKTNLISFTLPFSAITDTGTGFGRTRRGSRTSRCRDVGGVGGVGGGSGTPLITTGSLGVVGVVPSEIASSSDL